MSSQRSDMDILRQRATEAKLYYLDKGNKLIFPVLGGDLFTAYQKPNGLCEEHIWRYRRDGTIRERQTVYDILRDVNAAVGKKQASAV